LAQRLYDITALEPLIRHGFTLLTPNQRLARRIKSEWDARRAAAGEGAWEPLAVHTLDDWLLGRWELAVSIAILPPLVPLGAAQALELWRQVIAAEQGASVHYPLLLPEAAAEIAHQARELLRRWQVDPADPRVRQLFMPDRDCHTFWRWLQSFEARLEQAGLCTPVDCLAQLSSVASRLPRERVVLLEFDEIPPLMRTALEGICGQVETFGPQTSTARRLIHPFNDKRAELQTVAAWAANLQRAEPTTTIGIVPGDMQRDRIALEYLLRREFDCVGANYNSLPVNFSTGTSLARTPLVRDALAALAMGLSHTTVPAVVDLLHSRFLDLWDARSVLQQRFVNRLLTMGRESVAIADLLVAAREYTVAGDSDLRMGGCLRAMSAMRELRRAAQPSAWATQFGAVLAVWGWPGPNTLDSVEYQQLALWDRVLDDLRAFDAVCGAIHYGTALALLGDCCARQVSHPQSADTPIQVLGPLEAAGLTFDHLWVCGMQAANWPTPARPNPFIPLALQSRLRMPHANAEREQAFSTALLQRYSRSCLTLHASYSRQLDGVADAPSALLEEFAPQAMPEASDICAAGSAGIGGTELEEVADHSAPQLEPEARAGITGGSRVLEDQSHCPYRAFARHRLHLAAPAEFHAALPAGARGALLHASLYALWGELASLAHLQAMDGPAQEHAVARAVDAGLSSVPASTRRGISASYWRLERQRLVALLNEWLSVEGQRSDFTVAAREEAFELELNGLPLRLRVDRIDELPDGSRVIIDYKSGSSSVQDWLGDRPAKPQLLLYAIAAPELVAGLAFARVAPRKCGFVGLGRVAAAEGMRTDIPRAVEGRMVAGDWPSLNACWRENLGRLAQAFVAGEAQVDPQSASSCDHCGLQSLCRIDAARLPAPDEAL
jgi:ATP-dependent helicase/nuclease subunit B